MLRGSSLVDHVLEDDPSAPPLLRPEDASAPATVTPGDNADRTPGVGEDGCTFDPPTAANPANDLDFCPGVGGGARCPDSKPSRCAPGCEDRGTCNQELGRCDCPRGMGGDACELGQLERFDVPETRRHVPPLCYNDCSGRGECVEGFCDASPAFSVPTAPSTSRTSACPDSPRTPPGAVTAPPQKCTCTTCPPGSTSTSTPASSIARSRFSFSSAYRRRTIARRIPTTRISSSAGRSRQRHRVVALGSREAQEGVSRRWSLLLSREGRVASSHTEFQRRRSVLPVFALRAGVSPGNESTEMWTSKKRNPATTPGRDGRRWRAGHRREASERRRPGGGDHSRARERHESRATLVIVLCGCDGETNQRVRRSPAAHGRAWGVERRRAFDSSSGTNITSRTSPRPPSASRPRARDGGRRVGSRRAVRMHPRRRPGFRAPGV